MIFVTGHKGFIGSHLLKGIDSDQIFVTNGDLMKLNHIPDSIDVIVHLAAKVNSQNQDLIEYNKSLTKKVIDLAHDVEASLIFTSSSAVYSPDHVKPIRETDKIQPSSGYGESKLACEELITNSELKHTILRLFNLYGENQNPKFIIPYLVHCAVNNLPHKLRTPTSVRDFIHIQDIIRILNEIIKNGNLTNEIFNIGSGIPTTIQNLVEKFGLQENGFSALKTEGLNTGNPDYSVADIEKIRSEYGWKPAISLDKGINNLIKYYKND